MYHISGQPPVQYFNRLPRKCETDVAYVLDPVVATAATVLSVVEVLKKVGSMAYIFGRLNGTVPEIYLPIAAHADLSKLISLLSSGECQKFTCLQLLHLVRV